MYVDFCGKIAPVNSGAVDVYYHGKTQIFVTKILSISAVIFHLYLHFFFGFMAYPLQIVQPTTGSSIWTLPEDISIEKALFLEPKIQNKDSDAILADLVGRLVW